MYTQLILSCTVFLPRCKMTSRYHQSKFVTLEHVLENIENNRNHPIVFEYRPAKYMFGTLNYGEVKGWKNSADGDCWDVFAPGYVAPLPYGVPYFAQSVLGVLKLENGNHKIAVRVDAPGFDAKRARREIERYVYMYTVRTKKAGMWIKAS